MANDVILISKEDCDNILKNCFNNPSIKYVSHNIKSLSGDVEGYLSDHHSLEISYQENHEIKAKLFFVKVVIKSDSFLKEMSHAMDAFNKESFLYTKMIPELDKLKYFQQIFPKCYLAKENVLILENLNADGFQIAERLVLFTVEKCKVVLRTLAHYHAYGIAYEEIKTKINKSMYRLGSEYPKEFQDKFFESAKNSPTTQFIKAALESLITLIEEIPKEKLQDKERFLKLMETNFSDITKNNFENKYRKTCTHGDLWSNNIMFKYEEGKIIDCRLIDFQMLSYNMPGADVELFFYGNTNTEFRNKHKKELLEYYYEEFSKVLEQNDVQVSDIMSLKDLEETCVLRAPEAKVQAICDISLMYFPDEFHEETARNPEYFKTFLIDQRSEYTLNVYKTNEKYRDIITTELIDLLHILQAKEDLLVKLK